VYDIVLGLSAEKYSVKLYAVDLKPRIKYVRSNEERVFLTDVSLAIAYSPTLSEVTGMKGSDILENLRVLRVKGRRAIEYPGGDELEVSEFVERYEYESPIPSWFGWIIGVAVTFALITILESSSISNFFPTWSLWLLVFFPIGEGWEYVFRDKTFHMSEIMVSGSKDKVIEFVRDLRSNLGRNPILALKERDLKHLSEATGMDLISLENRWDEIIHGGI